MIIETEHVVKPKSFYKRYIEKGGKLPLEDCLIARQFLTRNIHPTDENDCCSNQIKQIARECNLEITPCEIAIYGRLRKLLPSQEELSERHPPNIVNTWQMSDQVLAREIFLLTDESGEKYKKMTNNYPHIFSRVQ